MSRPTICTEELIKMLPVGEWFRVRDLGLDINPGSVTVRIKAIEEFKQRKPKNASKRVLEFKITKEGQRDVLDRIKKYGRVRIDKATAKKKQKTVIVDPKKKKENELFQLFMRA